MRLTKIILLSSVLLSLVGMGCGEKDADAESAYDLITKAQWKMDSYGVDVDMNLILTGTEIETRTCDTDDTYTFGTPSGKVTVNFGSNLCTPGTTSFQDDWNIATDGSQMLFRGYTYKIKTLTQNRLEVYSPGPASNAIVILTR